VISAKSTENFFSGFQENQFNTILYHYLLLGATINAGAETTGIHHPDGNTTFFDTHLLFTSKDQSHASLEHISSELTVRLLANHIQQSPQVTGAQLQLLKGKGYLVEFVFTNDNIVLTISSAELKISFAKNPVSDSKPFHEPLNQSSWQFWFNTLQSTLSPGNEVQSVLHEKAQLHALKLEVSTFLTKYLSDGMSVSPPPLDKQSLADLIFVDKRDDEVIAPRVITITGFAGKSVKDGKPETIMYHNVAGIIVVANDLPLSDRKKLTRAAKNQLRRLYPQLPVECTVITVDQALFEQWQKHGLTSQTQHPSTRTLVDYGSSEYLKTSSPPQVTLFAHGVEQIGGNQLFLRISYDGGISRVIALDPGWNFNAVPGWKRMGTQPTPMEGLLPYFERGMLPIITRYYREELLRDSMGPRVILQLEKLLNSGNSTFSALTMPGVFIALEITHRNSVDLCFDLLREVAGETLAQAERTKPGFLVKAKKLLQQLEQRMYRDKTIYDGIGVSHSHADHAWGLGAVRPEIPLILSPITRAALIADHTTAANPLARDSMVIRQKNSAKVGQSYPTIERPFFIPMIGVPLEVAPDVFLTALPVDHMAGSLGFFIEVYHKGQVIASFAYPGDYKTPRFFDELIGLGKKVHLLFLEGTNPPKTEKTSAFFTESDVRNNFQQLIAAQSDNQKLLIIDMQKNNFERIRNLVEVCQQLGKTVLMSTEMLNRLIIIMQSSTAEESTLQFLNEKRIRIWKRKKSSYPADELHLHEVYGAVTTDEVAAHPEQHVIIRTSNESPEKLSQLAECPTVWVISGSEPFNPEAKEHRTYLDHTAALWDWTFLKRGFHSSGHAPVLTADHPDAEAGVLARLSSIKPGQILIGHTKDSQLIKSAIRGYHGMSNVPIIDFGSAKERERMREIPIYSSKK
jgi:hypothetical protein